MKKSELKEYWIASVNSSTIPANSRRLIKRIYKRNFITACDALHERQKLKESIQAHTEGGEVGYWYSSTDCDHCTFTSFYTLPATVMHWLQRERTAFEDVEGATYMVIKRPSEENQYSASFHDGIAEAYENGHAHVVYQ